jgi:hypothetical protein
VLYNGTWEEKRGNDTVTRVGPYPVPARRLRYAAAPLTPQALSYGLSEPRPAQRAASALGVTMTYRTGTLWGLRDADEDGGFDPRRVADIVLSEEGDWSTNDLDLAQFIGDDSEVGWNTTVQLSQRVALRLNGLVNRKAVGYMGSASVQDRRVFAIQIYQTSAEDLARAERGDIDEIPPEKFLMRYYNNHVNDPCLTGVRPAQGTACPEGVDMQASGMTEWFSATNSEEVRLVCPPGTRSLSATGTDCVACAIGHISTQVLSPDCRACPLGSYADLDSALIPQGGASVCRTCAPGTFSGETAASSCGLCSPGLYSKEGSIACSKCAKGTVSTTAGAAACSPCPANSSTTSEGMSECKLKCLAGAAGVGGVEPCQACQLGSFAALAASTTCEQCTPGSSTAGAQIGAGGGRVECKQCAAGSFAPEARMASCRVCPAQSYQGAAGSTACYLCPLDDRALAMGLRLPDVAANLSEAYKAAIYAPMAASSAQTSASILMRTRDAGSTSAEQCYRNCLPGTASDAEGLDFPDAPCTPCVPGTSTHLIGATVCPACHKGYYASSPSQATCLACEEGSFAELEGSHVCGQCAPGTYAAAAAAVCTSCANGSFTPAPGTPAAAGCTECPEGEYAGAKVRPFFFIV